MGYFRNAALAAAAIALPAAAQAESCWSAQQAEAAALRDFQTMLMVSTLRCQAAHFEIAADYNAFVAAGRPMLEAANGVIKARFRVEAGPVAGQVAYDRFTTALANAYGVGATTAQDCARAGQVARAAAAAPDRAALLALAGATLFGSAVTACATAGQAAVPIAVLAIAAPEVPVLLAAAPAAPVPVAWAAAPGPDAPVALASLAQ